MKKLFSVLLFALFVINYLHAQTGEALTNTTIIKMVKANLSDDLIIDEINSSKINFNVSIDSLNFLSRENVSYQVIQAMKTANGTQKPSVQAQVKPQTPPPVQEKPSLIQNASPAVVQVNAMPDMQATQNPLVTGQDTPATPLKVKVDETVKQPATARIKPETPSAKGLSIEAAQSESVTAVLIENQAGTLKAISYVYPATDLIPFYNSEFSSLVGLIQEWDKKIKASLEKEKQNTLAINKIEKELTDKKNANSKAFSKDIVDLKKILYLSWENHKSIKKEMIAQEQKLIEELKGKSKEVDNAIDAKFMEVSKNVKNAQTDPALGETAKTLIIPSQKFSKMVTTHFVPVSMMLRYYQNAIISLQDKITGWNEEAIYSIQKDSQLRIQLEPFQNKLSQFQAAPKQDQKLNKKEISALKKQCDNIERERKQVAKQMSDNSDKLSEELMTMKSEVQGIVKERFTDIIENIEHSYQDKFNL